MSARHPILCWFVCLAGLIGLFAAWYAKLASEPAPFTPAADTRPNFQVPQEGPALPALTPFDAENAPYVMFAFPLKGLFPSGTGGIDLGRPEPVCEFPIIRRGPTPEPITGDFKTAVTLEGEAPGFAFPMTRFSTRLIAAGENPGDGEPVETAVVTARSAAWGCGNCHGREPGHDDRLGLAPLTERNILMAHDRLNRTELMDDFVTGQGVACASCHDNDPALPNLSTAMHGAHALMDLPADERACNSCHPADSNGDSLLQRDLHASMGIGCTSCHGDLREHALALLKAEKAAGKAPAERRFAQLAARPGGGMRPEEILARVPGENLPDCTGCHDFQNHPIPGEATAFSKWTAGAADRFSRRYDDTGKLRCPTCHGAPHVMYPARDLVGDNRDNLQALRYLKGDGPMGANNTCGVCHQTDMDFFVHHGLPE